MQHISIHFFLYFIYFLTLWGLIFSYVYVSITWVQCLFLYVSLFDILYWYQYMLIYAVSLFLTEMTKTKTTCLLKLRFLFYLWVKSLALPMNITCVPWCLRQVSKSVVAFVSGVGLFYILLSVYAWSPLNHKHSYFSIRELTNTENY